MKQGYETKKKRIGAFTYHVTQLDAKSGSRALLRLLKIAGPALEAGEKGGETAAGTKLVEMLSEKDFDYFCELLAGQTTVTGGSYDEDAEPALDNLFDQHFASNYLDMFAWLAFALEVNFGSFFVGVVAKLAAMAAKAKALESGTASTFPTTSTGTSGES